MPIPNNSKKTFKYNEFDIISKYFAPLATSTGSLGLLDDGAIFSTSVDNETVLTTDTIISGVHFLQDAGPEDIAARLLAVNISDLAAMGASPIGYLLAISLTRKQDCNWLDRFAKELNKAQQDYGLSLYGGDTVLTSGPLTLTLTAFGSVPKGKSLKRSGAKAGDLIYVSGTIGDAYLGLSLLSKDLTVLNNKHRDYLIHRFKRPEPRYELSQNLLEIATSAIDVSDGLIAELGHICKASNVGGQIFAPNIPLSIAASSIINDNYLLFNEMISGGDDYELLFTIPKHYQSNIEGLKNLMGIKLTQIGVITSKKIIKLLDSNKRNIDLKKVGYSHF